MAAIEDKYKQLRLLSCNGMGAQIKGVLTLGHVFG